MRAISHIKKFGLGVIPYRERPGVMGVEVLCPGYTAQFRLADLTDAEIEFATKRFGGQMNGMTYEADEVTPVGLISRISSYDSLSEQAQKDFAALEEATYNPQTKEYGMPAGWAQGLVEAALLANQNFDMAVVVEVPVEAPWPAYADFRGSFEDLALKVVGDGYDIDRVIRHERQNLNRQGVLDALDEARTLVEVTDQEVVPA